MSLASAYAEQDRKNFERHVADAIGVVFATRYEYQMLWEENQRRDEPRSWESQGSGMWYQIGEIVVGERKKPVCMTIWTAVVDGHKILFVEPTSQAFDYEMARDWLKTCVPTSAFRPDVDDDRTPREYLNEVDPTNFHNIFPRGARRCF